MATVVESERTEADNIVYRVLKRLRGSLLLSFVALGVVLLGIGMVFEIANVTAFEITQQDGVIAGMLGVFGISSIITAGFGYLILQVVQRR